MVSFLPGDRVGAQHAALGDDTIERDVPWLRVRSTATSWSRTRCRRAAAVATRATDRDVAAARDRSSRRHAETMTANDRKRPSGRARRPIRAKIFGLREHFRVRRCRTSCVPNVGRRSERHEDHPAATTLRDERHEELARRVARHRRSTRAGRLRRRTRGNVETRRPRFQMPSRRRCLRIACSAARRSSGGRLRRASRMRRRIATVLRSCATRGCTAECAAASATHAAEALRGCDARRQRSSRCVARRRRKGEAPPTCAVTDHCSRHEQYLRKAATLKASRSRRTCTMLPAGHTPGVFNIRSRGNPSRVEHRRRRQIVEGSD